MVQTQLAFSKHLFEEYATSIVSNTTMPDWHKEAIVLKKVSFDLTKDVFGYLQYAFEWTTTVIGYLDDQFV